MFNVEMHKLIKEDVRPWTEYLGQALERTSEGRQPIVHDNRFHGDDTVQPHIATGFATEEAAKPEIWFEVQ